MADNRPPIQIDTNVSGRENLVLINPNFVIHVTIVTAPSIPESTLCGRFNRYLEPVRNIFRQLFNRGGAEDEVHLEEVVIGSVKLVLHVKTRRALDNLWQVYLSGELKAKINEIIAHGDQEGDETITLSHLTMLEDDYKRGCDHFTQKSEFEELLRNIAKDKGSFVKLYPQFDANETAFFGQYFESQLKSLPPSEVLGMMINKPKVAACISYRRDDTIVAFNYLVKCLAEEPSGKGMEYLSKVNRVTVEHISSSDDMNHIMNALSCMQNLVDLNLNNNDKLGGSAASWAHHLKQLKELENLCMNGCMLTGEDMNHIGGAVSCIRNLKQLNLRRNDLLGGSIALWADHLTQLKQLQRLDMWGCRLTDDEEKIVHGALGDPTFTVVIL